MGVQVSLVDLWRFPLVGVIEVGHILQGLAIAMMGMIAVFTLFHWVLYRLELWARKTSVYWDDFIILTLKKNFPSVFYLGAIYWGLMEIPLPPKFNEVLFKIWTVVLLWCGMKTVVALIDYLSPEFVKEKVRWNTSQERGYRGLIVILKMILWVVAIIFLLDNLGFKISTVVAGLGIGGVAIALASQAFLGDIFNYFVILFDRPFEIGDYIVASGFNGTIEEIGIKTTRIRGLGGELLVFSNTELMKSVIRNYKKMIERRVLFRLNISYQTNQDKLKLIPHIVKEIIEKKGQDVRFDRCHFFDFGQYSLVIETVYYVIGNDYNIYMDIQQEINLDIIEQFKLNNIEFIYLNNAVAVPTY